MNGRAGASRGLLASAALLSGTRLAANLAYGIALLAVARVVSPATFGALGVTLAAASLVVALTDAGLVTAGLRMHQAASSEDSHIDPVALVGRGRLVVTVVALLPLLPLTWIYCTDLPHREVLIGGLELYLLTNARVGAYLVSAQARQSYSRWAVGDLAGRVTTATGVVLAATGPHRVWIVGPALWCGSVVALLVNRRGPKLADASDRPTVAQVRALMQAATPLGIAFGLNAIYFRVDSLLLAALLPRDAVGAYALAYRVLELALLASSALQSVLIPRLLASRDLPSASRSSWGLALRAFLPGTVLLAVSAGPLLRLIGGSRYGAAVTPLRLLAPSLLLTALNAVTGAAIIAARAERRALWLNLVALGGNVALNLVLIPIVGIAGAAAATTLSELLTLLLCARIAVPRLLRTRWVPDGWQTSLIAGVVLMAVAAAAVTTSSGGWLVAVSCVACALVQVALLRGTAHNFWVIPTSSRGPSSPSRRDR